jgi:hypothetical protein
MAGLSLTQSRQLSDKDNYAYSAHLTCTRQLDNAAPTNRWAEQVLPPIMQTVFDRPEPDLHARGIEE